MARARHPIAHDPVELFGRVADVRRREQLENAVLAARERALNVAREHGLEGLAVGPVRVLRRERAHAVERERELHVDRLLGPERAVVVERRDALGRGHEVRSGRGDARDEADDRIPRGSGIPRGQRIGRRRL
jgi:hypothetical protein